MAGFWNVGFFQSIPEVRKLIVSTFTYQWLSACPAHKHWYDWPSRKPRNPQIRDSGHPLGNKKTPIPKIPLETSALTPLLFIRNRWIYGLSICSFLCMPHIGSMLRYTDFLIRYGHETNVLYLEILLPSVSIVPDDSLTIRILPSTILFTGRKLWVCNPFIST